MVIKTARFRGSIVENMGLKNIDQKFNSINVLTGKNGSGKSRVLQLIKAALTYENKSDYFSFNRDLQNNFKVVNFVPSNFNFTKSDMTRGQLQTIGNQQFSPGMDSVYSQVLPYIQYIDSQFVYAHNPVSAMTKEERDYIICKHEKLNEYIKRFLGTKIDRDSEQNATLFDRKLDDMVHILSNGQKINLQLAFALFSQSESLENLVILLDEPENHLHPSALYEMITELRKHTANSQMFISTHSLGLVSYLYQENDANIYFLEDGEIFYAGSKPLNILRGLIGNDDDISKFKDLFLLPAELASNKFCIESLLSPEVLMTDEDDPQVNQIIDVINTEIKGAEQINVLDFGSGKCRLLATYKELETKIDTETKLSYFAYDLPDNENIDFCKEIIRGVYGDKVERYYTSLLNAEENFGSGFFDLVILCNVFHEIDPNKWCDTFGQDSSINRLLKDNGFLLIVEDHRIPVGEKAYKNGFLVLDEKQFKLLFDIEEYAINSIKNGRLKAHLIPSNSLKNMTSETIKNSIQSLNMDAKNKIISLRSGAETTFRNGREHGFWVMQYTNSQLCLDDL